MELDPQRGRHSGGARRAYLRQSKVAGGDGGGGAGAEDRAGQSRSQPRARHLYAALVGEQPGRRSARPRRTRRPTRNLAKAIQHLEPALDGAVAESDPNVRATLARLYVARGAYDKAIPLLTDLVNQEPGWQDGPLLLAEAYAGAGREPEAIAWLEERRPTIRGCCRRSPTSTSASAAGPTRPAPTRARLQRAPRNTDLKTALRVGADERRRPRELDKARDALNEVVGGAADRRARALSAVAGAAAARRRQGGGGDGAQGHRAEQPGARGATTRSPKRSKSAGSTRRSSTSSRRSSPSSAASPATTPFDVGLLLPHLGFAYQELGQYDKAIATFEEARKLAPSDPAIAGYLIEANICRRRNTPRRSTSRERRAAAATPTICGWRASRRRRCARAARPTQGHRAARGLRVKQHADEPDRLRRAGAGLLRGRARRAGGEGAAGRAGEVSRRHDDRASSSAPCSTSRRSSRTRRRRSARCCRAIRTTRPRSTISATCSPSAASGSTNRSSYLKKALQIEPDNGSYLDSLGWAYFKADKLDLARRQPEARRRSAARPTR